MVVHIISAKEEFDTYVEEAGDKLVVVDFFANWCGPCKVIAPYLEELSVAYTDVLFLKVDVEEQEELAQEYNISCMPTFIFLKNKGKIDEFSGANKDKLKEIIEGHK